jgi:hypothetical protein
MITEAEVLTELVRGPAVTVGKVGGKAHTVAVDDSVASWASAVGGDPG